MKERDDKISSLKGANKAMAECTAMMKREAVEELDDAVEEIGRLKIQLEGAEKGRVAASEKFAALQVECKGRGREIAAMREAIANLKRGKKEKEVERSVQTEVTPVLVVGTQTNRRTYASVLAQTEEVSIESENTNSMDIETPPPPPKDKTTSRAGSPTDKPWNTMPTPTEAWTYKIAKSLFPIKYGLCGHFITFSPKRTRLYIL